MYFVIKNCKRGVYFGRTAVLMWHARARRPDVARGTCADATWHARPHGRAARAHVRHRWRTGHGHVAWPRESRWTPGWPHVAGSWQVTGPRVSGPWLEVWGDKANAFSCPTFYTYLLPNFLSCGTMSLMN